jgi:hypothetical protein
MKKNIFMALIILAISGIAHAATEVIVKPINTSQFSLSNKNNIAALATDNVLVSGNLYHVEVINLIDATRWIWLYDGIDVGSTLTDTLNVHSIWPIPASPNTIALGPNELGLSGDFYSTAIAYGISTSPTLFSAGAAGDCVTFLKYK